MRTRQSITRQPNQPVHIPAARWAAWAAQLVMRRGRWPAAPLMPLPLYVRLCRVPSMLYQRWLSLQTQVYPQINLSIAGRGVWYIAPPNVYAPQMVFLQSFVSLLQQTPMLETERWTRQIFEPARPLELRRTPPAHVTVEGARQVALALALARTRTEHLSSMLHRQFSTRQEAVLHEVSRRLTQRVQRVDEVAVVRPAMALRKETPAIVTPKPVHTDALAEQSSFERRSSAYNGPAMKMPELNVEQLAQQVLQQIDRRVIARRERMGQV